MGRSIYELYEKHACHGGDIVFAEGEAATDLYVIKSGSVEISRNGQAVEKLGPGEVFGVSALDAGATRPATAKTTGDAEIFRISRKAFREIGLDESPLAAVLTGALLDRQVRTLTSVGRRAEIPAGAVDFNKAAYKTTLLDTLEQIDAIQKGIENREFVPFLQPVVDLPGGAPAGFETLIRWDRPGEGLVAPYKFIPLAEKTGIVRELDLEMLRRACELLPDMQGVAPERDDLFLTVNLSGVHFSDDDFIDSVREIVAETGADPAHIKLELTETAVMENPELAAEKLREFKDMGFKIALDDFGTGYSSLGYLSKFPVDTIKLDRSFVGKLTTDSRNLEILSAVIDIAKRLDMTLVGEGIEDEVTGKALASICCDMGQGYHYAKPMPAAQAKTWLAERCADAPANVENLAAHRRRKQRKPGDPGNQLRFRFGA